jgi:ElaB/YqjD/DUF883 family membrane-anchored ribosome-binding protein
MAESMDDVRYDIQTTRQRMSETLSELDAHLESRKAMVADKVNAVKGQLDPERVIALVQEHPWAAVAVAFGLGAFLGGSGADRAIASATAGAATGVAHSTADAARSAAHAVTERVRGSGSDAEVPIEAQRDDEGEGLVDRLAGQVGRVIRIEELESDMRRAFVSHKLPTSI